MPQLVRVLLVLLALIWVGVSRANDQDKERRFSLAYSKGPVQHPSKYPSVSVVDSVFNRKTDVVLEDYLVSLDEVYYCEDRCIVLASLSSSGNRSLYIIDLPTAKVVYTTWCFFPVPSPDRKWIAFEKFYPRGTPLEIMWPALLVVAANDTDPSPVQVFPDEESKPDEVSRVHYSILPDVVWSEESDQFVFLGKHGESGWDMPQDVYFVLVKFKKGVVQPAKRSRIDVQSFVRADQNPERVGFMAEKLVIEDGRVKGKLYPQSYRIRDTFAFDLKSIEEERPLGIKDIVEPASIAPTN
ncbi:MAG: hypothetical protein HUU46_02570 [Candidatus Hydrogenedentes bacterium]|nr:hypothetical protein [Candidatus Hydrogenedentota bacterium]